MNANAVARNYGRLTPEERFRLILAASGRSDEAERERLVNAGERIKLTMPDHYPYANAFDELALEMLFDLLEWAACYFDAFIRADEACEIFGDDEPEGDKEGESAEAEDAPGPAQEAGERPAWQRAHDMALACGFILRTRADGWKLFCERMNVPPFLLWEVYPGFDRLQRALALAETAAFTPEDYVRWLNRIRRAGEPEVTHAAPTVEGLASANEKAFRQRVEWWGGE
jgi:hypothetical protein